MSDLERWRLILGEAADACLCGQPMSATAAGRDAALDWLYGRDDDLDQRDVRRRAGGDGASQLTTMDWLDQVNRLFPKETVERLERDAVERYQIPDVLTDPEVLGRIEPNATLLKAVLRTKHLMNPEVLALARRIVRAVVQDLVDRLAVSVRQSFTGARSRRPSRFKQARNLDMRRTIRANLGNYQPDQRRLLVEDVHFFGRTRRQLEPWQFILLVDQSGSMVSSVIHSAVTAACLWGLPGIRTHLVAFDTEVVDLTADVDDPVELLMKVQLGGGTDIARAVRYGAGLVDNPRRAIVAVVTDFYEGGPPGGLVRAVRGLVEQGTHVLGLAALDEEANPSYDRQTAQLLADAGAHVGAMTPAHLAEFVAEKVGR
ncbi:VWA domain containing CoxE-like protein [Asanoa hainanensis]|uniref:VWA domain containing CoxE-like protein n=1 Tax=Asanoa hainanensis TaxID=560556 RepID=A0A239PAZ1_9ACTN|nr:VWA domain-containing protein [Asanoa hainanensis]SNT64231.1 VWA domain containing CoxE-like protein [Asanoa hainanensis]